MKITVSGNKDRCDVVVEGLGKAEITLEFDENKKILSKISFTGNPRSQTNSQRKKTNLKRKKDEENRHITGHAAIKDDIITRYLNKNVDDLVNLYPVGHFGTLNSKEKYSRIGKFIGKEYLTRYRNPKNMYLGAKEGNNNAGKLVYLLKEHIEKGSDFFEIDGKLTIKIPKHKQVKNDLDFYGSLIKELQTSILEIESWDMLLEMYFAASYDLPPNITYKDPFYQKKEQDFLTTYQKHGEYTCGQTLFKPQQAAKKKKAKDYNSDIENDSDQEITNNNNQTDEYDQEASSSSANESSESDTEINNNNNSTKSTKRAFFKSQRTKEKKTIIESESDQENSSNESESSESDNETNNNNNTIITKNKNLPSLKKT